MTEAQHSLSLETCQVLLAEIDPSSRFVSVRPMGADGTNPAFVIEARTATGTPWQLAVKCYLNTTGKARTHAQLEFKTLQMLQKHAVPVPAALYLDETGVLLGLPGMVTTFAAGQQVLAPPDALACAREMALVLAKIHSIPVGPAEKVWLEDANQAVLWFRKTGVIPNYMVNNPHGQFIWDTLERLLPTWQPVPPTLVHTDYWIGQLLWQQGKISAVLDWEEAGYGDPAYDLAYCRMDAYLSQMGRAAADELLLVYEAEMGRPVVNLHLWEFAATPRPMHNPAWEAVCRAQLRDFIADVRQRAHE